MDEKRASVVTEVELPVEYVELKHFRLKNGEPVVVRCECVDELSLVKTTKALPGAYPRSLDEDEGAEHSVEDVLRSMERYDALSIPLIERGTSLIDPNGEEVCPGFYFSNENRHKLSLPGRMLRAEDRALLTEALLRVSGYIPGGAVEDGSFLHGERGDSGAGGEGVADGPGDGSDAVGGGA